MPSIFTHLPPLPVDFSPRRSGPHSGLGLSGPAHVDSHLLAEQGLVPDGAVQRDPNQERQGPSEAVSAPTGVRVRCCCCCCAHVCVCALFEFNLSVAAN